MKKLIIILLSYCFADVFVIFVNHFDLYGKPKPNYLFAWLPLVKESLINVYTGSSFFALLFLIAMLFILVVCFLIARGIVNYVKQIIINHN